MADYDSGAVIDNRERSRYELTIDGQTAHLDYDRKPDTIIFVHTEVPPSLRGHHLGDALARRAIDDAHAAGLKIVPVCPFVRGWIDRHQEYADLVAPSRR